MISATEFAQTGFQYLGTSYEEMDCQKFVERCMADVGLKMDLPGSNAWYREMDWVGTPEECKAQFGCVPKGAILFILEAVSGGTPEKYRKDGIGDATHMGIKTGQGKGAIHSSKSRGGVCESEFHDKTIPNGGWNRVGLYGKFEYEGITGTAGTVLLCSTDGGTKRAVPLFPDTDDSDFLSADEKEEETAVVTAESGKTVNMRKARSTKSKLVERVPIGATVKVLKTGENWSRVAYTDPRGAVWCGWMLNRFLKPETGEEPEALAASTQLYAVTIPYCTEEQARALLRNYAGAWMVKEEM